jgi:hypothetical protein
MPTQVLRPNAFIGNRNPPTEAELTAALGPARPLWDQLLIELNAECGPLKPDWSSYSPKAGWALCLRRNKRAIVYLSPHAGAFMASFALGDKALEAARQSGLPPRILTILKEARRYAEGTAVRLEVETPADIAAIRRLAAAKLAN